MKTLKHKGFSLIELLVVLGIIAILTSLTAFNFNQARERARDLQRKNDLKQLQNALEIYKNDSSQSFPNVADFAALEAVLKPTYIPALPVDPKESLTDSSWKDYTYLYNNATSYTLTACLENVSDPMGVGNCGPVGRTTAGRIYTLNNP